MASKSERHARSKTDADGGSLPSRSAERSAAVAEEERDPARRAPGRKDTRARCRGKPGAEHVPVLVLHGSWPGDRECRWRVTWSFTDRAARVMWGCSHREECRNCGKVLRTRPGIADAECPAYPGTREQRAEAEAALADAEERRRTWEDRPRRRKPPVTGPQGYRRRRAEA